MTQQNLLGLAKQGDANAIAILINRQLQPKGISAKASLAESCLHIILESASVPPQQELVSYIGNAVSKLGAPSIQKVRIYGKQTDSNTPLWQQEFKLQTPQPVNNSQVVSNTKSASPALQRKTLKVDQDTTLLECHGGNTTLIVKENGILIKRLGGLLSTHAKGERFISYKNIINIQFHNSTTFLYGFIYFQIVDSSISSIKYLESASNPKAVIFYNDKLSDFEKARLLILEKIKLPVQEVVAQQPEQQDFSAESLTIKLPVQETVPQQSEQQELPAKFLTSSTVEQQIDNIEARISQLTRELENAKRSVQEWVDANSCLSQTAAEERAKTQSMGRGLGGTLFGAKYRAASRRQAASINANIARETTLKKAKIKEGKQNAQELVRQIKAQISHLKSELKILKSHKKVSSSEKRVTQEVQASSQSLKLLEKLNEVYNMGLLTQEEYEEKCKKIVDQI